MHRRDIVSLVLVVTGILAILRGMQALALVVMATGGGGGVSWLSLFVLGVGLPVLLGLYLIRNSGRLGRLFDERCSGSSDAASLTLHDVQGLAFSAVGLYLAVGSAFGVVQNLSVLLLYGGRENAVNASVWR